MSEVQLIATLSFALSIAGLLGLLMAFRGYREDSFRDQLFELRDEMFLYAFDQGLLESSAYSNLRVVMNSLIRYAHEISFARLLLLAAGEGIARIRRPMPPQFIEWIEAVKALPPEQGEKIHQYHARMFLIMMVHMIIGSPTLLVASAIIGMYGLAIHPIIRPTKRIIEGTARTLQGHVPPLDLLETEAVKCFGRG